MDLLDIFWVTGEADEGEWTVDEAAKNFQPSNEGNSWRTAFKEGVNLDERFLEGSNCENTPEEYLDYVARYDLAFLTPHGHQIRFKVKTKKVIGLRTLFLVVLSYVLLTLLFSMTRQSSTTYSHFTAVI